MIRYAIMLCVFLLVLQGVMFASAGMVERQLDSMGPAFVMTADHRRLLAFGLKGYPHHPGLLRYAVAGATTIDSKIEHLATLTGVTPNSAGAWAELFSLRVNAGLLDHETHHALTEAVRLGPFEPRVNELVLRAGATGWNALDAESRRLVLDAGIRVIDSRAHYRRGELLSLLRESGLIWLSCSQRPDSKVCHGL